MTIQARDVALFGQSTQAVADTMGILADKGYGAGSVPSPQMLRPIPTGERLL
jgi:hypothetical protein